MTCEELQSQFELYSLGLLQDEVEIQHEIQQHLARNCDVCRKRLREAIADNALIMATAPQTTPPRRLKRRVLAGFGIERAGWGWLGALATASMLMIALWLSVQERRRESELAESRRDILQVTAERDRLTQAFSFLNQPETRQVNFGKDKAQPPRGNVFVNSRMGVLLVASNLPALAQGRTYEMWVFPSKDSAPRPAGLFQSDAQGLAMHILSGPLNELYAVAVTNEPAAGSAAPTTMPVIVAAL